MCCDLITVIIIWNVCFVSWLYRMDASDSSVLNELFLSFFVRISEEKNMNISVKFLHNDAESSTIVRRTKVPIITFKEIIRVG